MPADTHLGISEATKQDVEQLKHKLSLRYNETFTHDRTVAWLVENAPDPDNVDVDADE